MTYINKLVLSAFMVFTIAFYLLRNHLSYANEPKNVNAGTVKIDQFKLNYLIEGQGEPALVIGNTTYYPRTFSDNFKKHFKLHYIDHVGFAQTPLEPIENSRFEIPALIEDIETMRKALDLEKFIVIGHSGHGYLALEYAKEYPEHVSQVIMIATSPSLSEENERASDNYFEEHATPERKEFLAQNMQLMPAEIAANPEKRFIILLQRVGARSWYDYTYDSTPLWKDVVVNMQAVDHIWGNQFRDIDITRGLENFTVPVLLVLGKYDFFYPDSAIWNQYQPNFKNITIRLIDRCGHTPQLETPEQFDEIVYDWLQGQRS